MQTMARLTKADAARQLGISRTTLYKLIDQGKVSATPDGLIDTAELVRVASTVHVQSARARTPLYTDVLDAQPSGDEHDGRPVSTSSERPGQASSERQLTSTYRDLVDILREQLQAAQERERAYQEHIERLTLMLHEAQHRSDRLLEAPRRMPGPPGPLTPRGVAPVSRPSGDRGDMRRRILELVRDAPEGLTPAEIRMSLGVEKRLSNTCIAMLRDGLLQRVGPGRYSAHTASWSG